jgi:RNA recognition motif-containing protein
MKTLFIRHLPRDATVDEVADLFGQHGRVFNVKLLRDIFTGTCLGSGQVNMEGHEARVAIAALDGKSLRGKSLQVREDHGRKLGHHGRRR